MEKVPAYASIFSKVRDTMDSLAMPFKTLSF